MKYAASLAAVVSFTALLAASQAFAADADAYKPLGKGTLLIDLRVSDVVPSANSPIYTAAGADTGLKIRVGDSIMPTLGIDYFLTDQISVEAILGVTEHSIGAGAPGAFAKAHSTWVLPPVVTVKYHPFPKAKISPYVGAGANLMLYFAGHDFNEFNVKLKDEFGYAFQAGFDVPLTGPWTLNADAKKVFTNTRATINGGTLTSNVALDPWVVSIGVGRRF